MAAVYLHAEVRKHYDHTLLANEKNRKLRTNKRRRVARSGCGINNTCRAAQLISAKLVLQMGKTVNLSEFDKVQIMMAR